jgi:hypothetical protein
MELNRSTFILNDCEPPVQPTYELEEKYGVPQESESMLNVVKKEDEAPKQSPNNEEDSTAVTPSATPEMESQSEL